MGDLPVGSVLSAVVQEESVCSLSQVYTGHSEQIFNKVWFQLESHTYLPSYVCLCNSNQELHKQVKEKVFTWLLETLMK